MSYVCQTCKVPLVVDESLEELSHAQRHLLTIPYGGKHQLIDQSTDELYNEYPQIPHERQQLFDKVVKSAHDKSSFVILDQKHMGNETVNDNSNLSGRLESLDEIFNVISSRYEIDYPVCSDCANIIMNQLKQKLSTLEKENETYGQFLKKLTSQRDPSEEEVKSTLDDLKSLKDKEIEVLNLLQEEERINKELNEELAQMEIKLSDLRVKEEQCCIQKNNYELDISSQLDKLERSKTQYYQNMDLLDSLRNTNVFDSLFDISYKGPFGTINGLRLGSLPETNVSWHEINAALGQVVLLLSTCLNILQIGLDGYKLIPMGSTSRIEFSQTDSKTGEMTKTQLKLFTTGEFSIGGFLKHNNLDRGMAGLLDVMNQISLHLHSLDSSNIIPYPIKGDTIAGITIRPSNRSKWETWTSACKFLLVDANWIKTFCVAQYLNSSK